MSDVKGLREISNDPFGKLLTSLSKKFSAFLAKDQAELVENPEDVYSDGQDVESTLKWHSFAMSKKFNLTTSYYSMNEPDRDKLRVWIIAKSLGNTLRDYSEEGRIITIFGDPILVDGTPFDWGIGDGVSNTKSIAMRMNRPTSDLENRDHITINHTSRGRVSEGLTTGISFFIRFRMHSFAQQNGIDRTLFEKTDNNPVTDAVTITVDTGGRLEFLVENTNVQYNWETVTPLSLNTVYDAFLTYNKTGNAVKIYLNGTDQTLQASGGPSYHTDLTNLDATIFSRGAGDEVGDEAGSVYGDLYDFRVYREKVISQTEVTRMWTNKWTISNIPFGQVAISNYSCSIA